MATQNPRIAEALKKAREGLEQIKAEKLRLYPPNPHPLAQPDAYPGNYAPEQIRQRNQLVAQIEMLEKQIELLQDQLYQK